MSNPFAEIIQGKDRVLFIDENEHFIAVLEKQPLVLGHAILISKIEQDDLFELPDAALESLMVFAKRIADAIKASVPCEKIGTAVIGLHTRHAHLHLVPISTADDLNFTRAKLSPSADELTRVLEKIRTELKAD